jgi:hypothetical protein
VDQVDEARVRVEWSEERHHIEGGEPAGFGLVGFVEPHEAVVAVVQGEINGGDVAGSDGQFAGWRQLDPRYEFGSRALWCARAGF